MFLDGAGGGNLLSDTACETCECVLSLSFFSFFSIFSNIKYCATWQLHSLARKLAAVPAVVTSTVAFERPKWSWKIPFTASIMLHASQKAKRFLNSATWLFLCRTPTSSTVCVCVSVACIDFCSCQLRQQRQQRLIAFPNLWHVTGDRPQCPSVSVSTRQPKADVILWRLRKKNNRVVEWNVQLCFGIAHSAHVPLPMRTG